MESPSPADYVQSALASLMAQGAALAALAPSRRERAAVRAVLKRLRPAAVRRRPARRASP